MITSRPDMDYEMVRHRREEMMREAQLLRMLRPPKPARPAIRRRVLDFSCQVLIQAGEKLTEWGLRLQKHFEPREETAGC